MSTVAVAVGFDIATSLIMLEVLAPTFFNTCCLERLNGRSAFSPVLSSLAEGIF